MVTYGDVALAALGDPTRRAIVERLAAGPLPVGELASDLPVSRPAVSQHLKVLLDAGVVGQRANGTRRIYYLDPSGIDAMRSYLDSFWRRALDSFAEHINAEHSDDQHATTSTATTGTATT